MQTEINSGFKLVPRIGMNSANAKKRTEREKGKKKKNLSREANEARIPELTG